MKKKELADRIAAIEKHLGIEKKEVELEVGKWYKHHTGAIVCYQNERSSYGFSVLQNKWIDTHWDISEGFGERVEATPEEVKSVLVEEAKRRGYKIGVKCLFGEGKVMRTIYMEEWKYKDDLNVLLLGHDAVFQNGKWAEIIEQPKTILEGKVAVFVGNKREAELVIKYLKSESNINEIISNYPKYEKEGFEIDLNSNHGEFINFCHKGWYKHSDYTIIPFSEFAKEAGIEVPVFIMKSEDGVDLYEGDKLFEANFNNIAKKWYLTRGENDQGYWYIKGKATKWKLGEKDGYVSKAFSTREAADLWISEQNKPKDIEVKLTSMVSAKITNEKVEFYLEEKSHTIQWLSSNDIATIHNAIQQMKGGDNA